MIKETIKYEKFDGTMTEKPFYFNINETEFNKWQLSRGGTPDYMKFQAEKEDAPALFDIYYSFIDLAYGEPTEDFEGFMKSPEILAKFKATDAYNQLCIKLMSDPDYADKFMKGAMSKSLAAAYDNVSREIKAKTKAKTKAEETE